MQTSSSYPVLWAVVLAALLGLFGSRAAAQSIDDDRAKAHFFAGESHFASERWSDAAREFALAYELSRRPEMLINLSRAHERNGQLTEAIGDLELLIGQHPDNPYRREAETRIAAMRKSLAENPAPPPVVAPTPEPPAELPALPPVTLAPEPEHTRSLWPPSVLTLAVGGVAVVAGVVSLATGLRAHHLYTQLEDHCTDSRCPDGFQSKRDHGQTLSRTSTALTFASVALAGSAAVLWVYEVKREQSNAVSWGIEGAGARMRARF